MKTAAILQTGRLGDLWLTIPKIQQLAHEGYRITVVTDIAYSGALSFVRDAHEVIYPFNMASDPRLMYAIRQAISQPLTYAYLKAKYDLVVWNQVFPYRMLKSRKRPFPEVWYDKRDWLHVDLSRIDLDICDKGYIVVNGTSISNNVDHADSQSWVEKLALKYGSYDNCFYITHDSFKHPRLQTIRTNSVQELANIVAGCHAVVGVGSAMHSIGCVLGKHVVAAYTKWDGANKFGTIGHEARILAIGEMI